MTITVLIPTHNPRAEYLDRTLGALRAQSLDTSKWELIVIDNCSASPLTPHLVNWHPHGRVIQAPILGLTHARLAGVRAARGDLLVWVDDDNLLAPDYLGVCLQTFAENPGYGAAGGKSIPEYETIPPAWHRLGLAPLGCRDLGDQIKKAAWSTNAERNYPDCAPIGAGMVVRKAAMEQWVKLVENDTRRQRFGRTGSALTSGEDNDINLTLLADGWTLVYLPSLRLTHIIPSRRITLDYQCRIARAAYRDFVRVLALHRIQPWSPIPRWTLPLRKLKAWFTHRVWSGPTAKILWSGSCGQLEGRADILTSS